VDHRDRDDGTNYSKPN